MTEREQVLEAGGWSLCCYDWWPGGGLSGAALVVHGQGDCAGRHATTVRPLVARGIVCRAVDLPGHGRSPGRRGEVPGFAVVTEVLAQAAADLAAHAGVPVTGWVGHSAGALIVVHHVVAAGAQPRFIWLSSPLVDPAAARPWPVVIAGRLASRWLPRLVVSTGVRRGDCRCDDGHHDPIQQRIDELGHDRIALGWARELLGRAAALPAAAARLPAGVRLLVTQGLADRVCPPAAGRRFFAGIPLAHKHWAELAGARHEPFADGHADELARIVGEWLDDQVLPTC